MIIPIPIFMRQETKEEIELRGRYLIHECKNCEFLIERYGYCPVIEEYVDGSLN